jgi:hypothetical protein
MTIMTRRYLNRRAIMGYGALESDARKPDKDRTPKTDGDDDDDDGGDGGGGS